MTRAARRAGLAFGVALAAAAQWGCSSPSPYVRSDGGARAVVPPASAGIPAEEPRSARGNPPFYDVLGKRYHVLPSSAGYKARGVASWYGRDFHGLSTSSGEPYNMNAMTAAHTTLPIPTWVEVTNLANGRRVIVKVNDRGPFVNNRLIDLSYAAAVKLDMIRNGTARVEVRALGVPPDAQPVLAAAGASSAPVLAPPTAREVGEAAVPPAQQIFVQVGAFGERANATRLVARLKSNGFVNAFVVTDGDGRRVLHRVRVGPLQSSTEFDDVSARLRSLGFGESQLVTAR